MATSAARLMEPVARRRVGATEKNTAVLVAVAMYGEEKVVKEGGDRFLREAAASVGLSCSQEVQEEEETLIQAYIDVTTAVQYLCENGRIRFHKGYSKSGLMGFCDPCPSMPKLLLVFYTYGGKSYKATISDTDGASLPSSGKLLDGDGTETGSQAQMVEAIARARWSILPEQN